MIAKISDVLKSLVWRGKKSRGLTSEREILLQHMAADWIRRAYASTTLKRPVIEEAVARIYKQVCLSKPEIYYAQSPLDCQKIARRIKTDKNGQWVNRHQLVTDQIEHAVYHSVPFRLGTGDRMKVWRSVVDIPIGKSRIETMVHSIFGHESELFGVDSAKSLVWVFYLQFFENLDLLSTNYLNWYSHFVLNGGVFMSIYDERVVVVCPGPSQAHFNEHGLLHNADGPAVQWEDGCKIFFLNGMPVSEAFFVSPAQFDIKLLLNERNAEVRKEIVRKIGVDQVVNCLGAKTLDRWGNYELLVLQIPGMRIRPTYLKMLNPSTGAWHLEGVPAEILSCRSALSWRDNEATYTAPDELT